MEVVVDTRTRNNTMETIPGQRRYTDSGRYTNSVKYTTSARYRQKNAQFLHDSYSSSLDFPAYIPWFSLSTDVNDKLKYGSVKINRSNCVEWASPIREENERLPLIDKKLPSGSSSSESDESEKGTTAAVRGGISWQVAAFLLINCALGAGVLNYPSAYDRVGGVLIATLIQLVLIVVLASTMIILVYSSDVNNDNTYHDVLLSMCGKRAQQLSAISIMLTCFGICVTFLIVIGDQYDRIFISAFESCEWYLDRRFTITTTSVLLILPLCYFRRLDFLRYAGTLGVFSMLYVVFLNVYQYMKFTGEAPPVRTSPSSFVGFFAVMPVICFAYQCHEIAVPVYACMEKRTIANFSKATALALGLLFVLYCAAGTCGYLNFGINVSPDIMQLYNAKDPLVMIGVVSLIIKMVSTYPPMIFCGRGALDGLYAEFSRLPAEAFIKGEKTRRIIITTVWFFLSLLMAIFTPNIGVVIELLGSLASANVFIFPSLCLIAIAKRTDGRLNIFQRFFLFAFACTLIITGVIIFGLVLFQVYLDLNSNEVSPIHEILCK